MKTTIVFLLFAATAWLTGSAQVTPYTGGIGSGYSNNFSPPATCSLFFGGSNDGSANAFSPVIICPSFFGDSADGAASNFSALTICPPFFGGPGDGHDMDSTNLCNAVLPLRNLQFYGLHENNRNTLYWQLQTAVPASRFELEKSPNGSSFTLAGTVNGSSNVNHLYQFMDLQPFPGITYYRLRIMERSGSTNYSNIIALHDKRDNRLAVYPNPAAHTVTLYMYSSENRRVQLLLYNQPGRVVGRQSLTLGRGANYFSIPVGHFSPGLYVLSIPETGQRVKLHVVR